MFSSRQGLIVALLTAVSLAACSGASSPVPFQATQAAAPMNLLMSDAAAPPNCKGQKKTTDYAKGPAQKLSTKGGTLCVPRFKSWGGSMDYPSPSGAGYTMSLTTSTTAYSGGYWPPTEPGAAIFYIAFQLNSTTDFGTKLPKGGALSSTQLKVNKPYTITGEAGGGSLWFGLGECYIKARAGKDGPYLTDLGYVFYGRYLFGNTFGVIEVIPGKFTSTKCT